MNIKEAMQELESLGSEQTRKTWRRHGGVGPMFGVKFGDLEKLRKKIKTDHALAAALWKTGNADARFLACMVADPDAATEKELMAWAADAQPGMSETLAVFASRSAAAAKVRKAWLEKPNMQRAGWSMVSHQAKDGDAMSEAEALAFLKRIEADIHKSENWTRRTMMYALISIGGKSPALRKAAEAAAKRIGPVEWDPGDTECGFPEPLPYIAKIWARKK